MAKGRIAINLEYAALCLLCTPLRVMPYGAAMGLADGLGWLLSCVFRFKRRRTLGRIRSVFPEKTSGECAFIARRSLQNFLRTVFEMVRATKLTRGWMDRHVADGR